MLAGILIRRLTYFGSVYHEGYFNGWVLWVRGCCIVVACCLFFVSTFTILNNIFVCRIMVLSEGQIIEFDTPSNLLESKGVFYNMAKDSNLVSSTPGVQK